MLDFMTLLIPSSFNPELAGGYQSVSIANCRVRRRDAVDDARWRGADWRRRRCRLRRCCWDLADCVLQSQVVTQGWVTSPRLHMQAAESLITDAFTIRKKQLRTRRISAVTWSIGWASGVFQCEPDKDTDHRYIVPFLQQSDVAWTVDQSGDISETDEKARNRVVLSKRNNVIGSDCSDWSRIFRTKLLQRRSFCEPCWTFDFVRPLSWLLISVTRILTFGC